MSFCDLPLDRIVVDVHFDVTDAYLERMKSGKNELFDVVLPVEKHPVLKDYFLLIGGFDRYTYLKKLSSAKCTLLHRGIHNSNRP